MDQGRLTHVGEHNIFLVAYHTVECICCPCYHRMLHRWEVRKSWLSLKPWGIALKFLFLHHENILFPND